MRGALAAALWFAALPAAADEVQVVFTEPVARFDPRAEACVDSRCGKLDVDGLLPLRVFGERGAAVYYQGRLASGGVLRLDLLEVGGPSIFAYALAVGAEVPQRLPLVFAIDKADAEFAAPVKVIFEVPASTLSLLRERIVRSVRGGGAWAATYDAAAAGPHPMLVLKQWRGRRSNRRMDDLARPLSGYVLPVGPKLGELQLIAMVDLVPRALGRCPRCAVGDFGWPEVEFRCERTRLDSEVTVYAARSGEVVAKRSFTGPTPGDCAQNMSFLMARGDSSRDMLAWLESLAGAPKGDRQSQTEP